MLRQMRENTGSWIIKILLGIIVIAFVFIGFGSLGSKDRNSVAKVNGDNIGLNEYKNAYEDSVARLKSRFGNNINAELLKAFNVKQQALDSLIEERLLSAQANKLDVSVSAAELKSYLISVPAFQDNGAFSVEKYKKVLAMNRMNPEIFEEMQTKAIKLQKVQNIIFDSVTVSDIEAENFYVYNNTKVKVDYLLFDPKSYKDLKPSEEEISKYYDENQNQYMSSPERKVSYLTFSPEIYKDKVKISDEKIQEYYKNNPNEFFTPEKVEARHILIKIAQDADEKVVEEKKQEILKIYDKAGKGEDFSELAKKYSEGPSKDSGGYLGSFGKDAMVKPFSDKAFAMKVNEISEPVRTQFGWHLIKVEAKFEETTQPLEEVSEKIKTNLETIEIQNIAYYEAGKAFDAIIDGDDLEQAALLTNTIVKNTEFFSSIGNGLTMPNAKEFANIAFQLEFNNISDVKMLGDSYYLVKVTDVKEPELLSLDQVKEEVIQVLEDQMQVEEARKHANEILSEAIENKSFIEIAKDKQLEVKTTQLFARSGSIDEIGNSEEFSNAAFSIPEEKELHSQVIQTEKGFFIISLNKRQAPEKSDIDTNLASTKEQFESSKRNTVYQAWIDELKQNSEIVINTELFN